MDINKEFIDVLMKQSDNKELSSDKTGVDTGVDTGVEGAEPLAEPLADRMSYNDVETMAFHLSLQLQVLEEKGFSLLFLQASDILVLDEQFYLLRNLKQMVPLKKKKNIKQIVLNYPTCYPLPKEACAPEVLMMSVLPFICNKSACYYSLGLLCLKVLHMSLEDLRGSKLFYFLERCLKDDPSERYLNFF